MTTEIELKYLVFSNNPSKIISTLLSNNNIEFIHSVSKLSNCYFDTPDLNLRQHDMGLRIREVDGKLEQTIKTAGHIIGGLHQRPEFNIPLKVKQPELSLFPNEIWQSSQKQQDIQAQLVSLFTTDFTRHTWLINSLSGAVIEIVFDQGEVSSNGLIDQICEIELELVRGNITELFDLAQILIAELELRPGMKSKAARGYVLWKQVKEAAMSNELDLLHLNYQDSISDVFIRGITTSLHHLQQSVEHYITAPSLTELSVIKETLALMEQGFLFFDEYLLVELSEIKNELHYFVSVFSWVDHLIYLKEIVNKKGNYRKKIDYSDDLVTELKLEKRRFPNIEEVIQVLHSQRFNQLQLSLLIILMPEQKLFAETESQTDILSFATEQLAKNLHDLINAIPASHDLTCDQYLDNHSLLNTSLHSGIWFAGLFDENERTKYRAPWIDLHEGITELQVLWLIQNQLKRLPEQPAKLVSWHQSKVENLLHALHNSKNSAIAGIPYWV